MIHTSNAFKDALLENSHCVAKATILLKNGETLQVDQTDIFQEGVKIDDGTSSTSTFDVGAAVIGKLTLSLNNIKDTFSNVDFTDAVITVWVGKSLGNTMEWLKKGVYNADDPQASASILSIEALDNMEKFDRNYDGSLTFPATMQSIVRHACNQCGVILGTNTFDFDTYVIQKNPFKSNEQVTWREILSHCAQIAGCYARGILESLQKHIKVNDSLLTVMIECRFININFCHPQNLLSLVFIIIPQSVHSS